MHDEAATHYIGMVDQTTLGHRLLKEEFGDAGIPTVAWQLDPFGHSATQAALLSAEAGMDALFFGRIDYQDLKLRVNESRAEFVWRASPSLGVDTQVFAGLSGSYGGNYGPPSGFNFNVDSSDEPIEDNEKLSTCNVKSRVDEFVKVAMWQANHTRGENIMMTMGSDFQYECAELWYKNLDKLISAVNKDGRISIAYSNPAKYVAAKRAEIKAGTLKLTVVAGDNADFFPYADGAHQFWTGYFTSRPALKGYIRVNSGFLNAARQALTLAGPAGSNAGALETFEEAMGVSQHHDAESGTAKQHVTFDYAKRISIGQAQGESVLSSALNALLGETTAEGMAKFGDSQARPEGISTSAWAQCRRMNESVCSFTQAVGATDGNGSTATVTSIAVWNGLGLAREELIRVPVNSAAVTVSHAGAPVPAQVLPAGETVNNYARNTKEATHVAVFKAELPPLGFATYTLTHDAKAAVAERQLGNTVDLGAGVVLENALVSLSFSNDTGALESWTNKATGTKIDLSQSFCYYIGNEGDKYSGQHSGAYIFRPKENTSDCCHPIAPTEGASAIISTHLAPASSASSTDGTLVQEVRQSYGEGGWITQTVRLGEGERFASFEYTVGEIPLVDPLSNKTLEQCVSWRQTG
jgi:alpha-mannosidase